MELRVIYKNARCAVLEIEDGGTYKTRRAYRIYLNGAFLMETDRAVTSIYGLKPDTRYKVEAEGDSLSPGTRAETGDRASMGAQTDAEDRAFMRVEFTTDHEFVTLNVRAFGAKGDGTQDDTLFIQAAIMACPPESRVLIPAGTYRISSLFLKSNINIELAGGAVLSAFTDRGRFPVFPGMIQSYDEENEYNLGTWEGNPLPMYTGIITGVGVEEVSIYGQGVIEGNAGFDADNWWHDAKTLKTASRPRMIFLERCSHVTVQGITVKNSPSWNIHPYFSDHLRFLDLRVLNPKDSPNTDGLDPESCRDVEIAGVSFSLGDDCIAVKSGKIYMGSVYKRPSRKIVIRRCLMRDGHGSVTVGSEMAGGVMDLTVKDCVFLHTDRGLRVKTRRGRGRDAVVDNIVFEHIYMDHVKTPFVVNCFYCCDPDGHSGYVRTKTALPVDHRTPRIGSLCFRDIEARNCHVAGAYLYGLPEQKIGRVEMDRVRVTCARDAVKGQPAMMDGCDAHTCRRGIYANNIEKLVLCDVRVEGQEGEAIVLENIGTIEGSI